MTNPLVQMREMQKMMRELEASMQQLQGDPALKRELEFEQELQALLAKFDKTIHEAAQVVDPSFRVVEAGQKRTYSKAPKGESAHASKTGKPNLYYLFTNPHTGDVVRTANILKKEVQEWINQYGKDEVLKWRTPDTAA